MRIAQQVELLRDSQIKELQSKLVTSLRLPMKERAASIPRLLNATSLACAFWEQAISFASYGEPIFF
jgi:hypothetical protein